MSDGTGGSPAERVNRQRRPQLALIIAIALLAACTSNKAAPTTSTGPAPPSLPPTSAGATTTTKSLGTIQVFAAASLTAAFGDVAMSFEAANPGTAVEVTFAGSPSLAQQIEQGAAADVFASADEQTIARLAGAGLITGRPLPFARNKLQIVVPSGNPKGVNGLADLARPDVRVALCAPQVPAGRYAVESLAKAGVTVKPVTEEDNVKAVVTKASLGEIDAGIVYVTDVKAAGSGVMGVEIPDDVNVVATYPVALVSASARLVTAQAFVDFVTSPEGQQILATYGFGSP